MLFSLLNVLTYSLAAHWVWGRDGFLRTLGVVDVAGSGAVHALGGMAGQSPWVWRGIHTVEDLSGKKEICFFIEQEKTRKKNWLLTT